MPVILAGTGSYLPDEVVTNADLERMVETSDEWIMSRTGIRERRRAAPEQAASDMAVRAGRAALEDAGLAPEELEMILVATCSPDMFFPNTACLVQHQLGAVNAFCMDLSAACSGFIYALETAKNFLETGRYRNALVIGAEKMSALVDWEDRTTCILFGDGAGAAVLTQAEKGPTLGASLLGSDGALGDLLYVPAGGSRCPVNDDVLRRKDHTLKMSGQDVFKHAVRTMSNTAVQLLEKGGWVADDLDLVIPHQANRRIIDSIRARLGVPDEKLFINVDKYGNTSAASVGIALDEAVKSGRVRDGSKVLLIAFGAGFTWGGILIEWRDK